METEQLKLRLLDDHPSEVEDTIVRNAGIEIPEIVHNILLFCDLHDIGVLMKVSKSFYRVSTGDVLWNFVFENSHPPRYTLFKKPFYRMKYPTFESFRVVANAALEKYSQEQKLQEKWRKKKIYITKYPRYLYFLSILCPPIGKVQSFDIYFSLITVQHISQYFIFVLSANILTYYYLAYEDDETELQLYERFQYPRDTSSGTHFSLQYIHLVPYSLIFPKKPQLLEFLFLFFFSLISCFFCCCFIGSLFSLFSVFSFTDRHRNVVGKQWSGDNMFLRICASICSPLHMICFFCCIPILCLVGIELIICMWFLKSYVSERIGDVLFLCPLNWYHFGCVKFVGEAYFMSHFLDMAFR